MTELPCNVCGKILDMYVDMPIYHDKCGHYACAHSCSDGMSDICQTCISPQKEEKMKVKYNNKKDTEVFVKPKRYEPQKVELKKGRWGAGLFRWTNDVSSALRNRNETVETSKDPFWLISKHVPIETLLEKELNINTLVEAGITIDQFLKAGYNIKELAKFPEVVPTKSDTDVFCGGVLVLFALKTRPHHLRDYRTLLPISDVYTLTGLTKQIVADNLGIRFHPEGGVRSIGDMQNKWTIENLRYLGFKTFDSFIMDLKLRNLSDWLTLNPSQIDIGLLGVTRQQIDTLNSDNVSYSQNPNPNSNNNNFDETNRSNRKPKETVRLFSGGGIEKIKLTPKKSNRIAYGPVIPRARVCAYKLN